jgi:hypothetical protein
MRFQHHRLFFDRQGLVPRVDFHHAARLRIVDMAGKDGRLRRALAAAAQPALRDSPIPCPPSSGNCWKRGKACSVEIIGIACIPPASASSGIINHRLVVHWHDDSLGCTHAFSWRECPGRRAHRATHPVKII